MDVSKIIFANYGKVNSKGVIPENTLIQNRDVIISKNTPIKENRNDPGVDVSKIILANWFSPNDCALVARLVTLRV